MTPIITVDTIKMISQQMSRFTVAKQVRMSQEFYDMAVKSGELKDEGGTMKFNGLPSKIDNSISTFSVDY